MGALQLDHMSLRCEGLEQVQLRLQSLGGVFLGRLIPQIIASLRKCCRAASSLQFCWLVPLS